MKKRDKNKLLIIILAVLTLIITCCFVFIVFKLERVKKQKTNFRIEFVNIHKLNPIKAGNFAPTSEASITNNGLSLDMSFDLYTPNDEITYNITVKNLGDIKGKIVNLVSVPDYINDDNALKSIYPVKINMTNIIGKELSPGEETNLKITVSYPQVTGKYYPVNIPYQVSLLAITS